MIVSLPKNTNKLINGYLNLRLGRHNIVCPYYQNITDNNGQAVYVGKGLPKEIETETIKVFDYTDKYINIIDPQTVRLYMSMANIGIDCSGFVMRVTESLLKEKGQGPLIKNLKPPNYKPFSVLRHLFKTKTNLSANTLSNKTNCNEILKYDDILPGDYIRVGTTHIAVITEVEKTDQKTTRIKYAHSTSDYADKHGVRKGEILITKPKEKLEKQQWTEVYKGTNWMLKDYLRAKPNDRGIRRLKSFDSN